MKQLSNTHWLGLLCALMCINHLTFAQQKTTLPGEGRNTQTFNFTVPIKGIKTQHILRQKAKGFSLSNSTQTAEILLPVTKIKIKKPKPFISAYLAIHGKNIDDEYFELSIRTSQDGKEWSLWKLTEFDSHAIAEGEAFLASQVEYFDVKTKYLQYKITTNQETPNNIIITKIKSEQYSPGESDEVKKVVLENQRTNARTKAGCSKPSIVTRSQWGARTPNASFSTSKVTHLVIHHELGSNSSSNWAARVKAVQNFHMNSSGYSDIGYNFLIDPNGVIYEGRAGGDNIVGAHWCSRNRNTMGVCILGNYTFIKPSAAAQASLIKLLTWKATKEGIAPLGRAYHYGVNGQMNQIIGHREGLGCSSCPGDAFFGIIGSIKSKINDAVNNGCGGSGGGGGGSSDTEAPTTSISAVGGNTQAGDFTVNFTDNDNVGVTRTFYQVLEKYGSQWLANRNRGFFNDNFGVLNTFYNQGDGTWSINQAHLRQANTTSSNTRLSTYLAQNSGLPQLYEFSAKVFSTSGPRKFGLHIMSDNGNQDQRGNSYLIWFSGEDNKVRIYETVNNVLNFRAIADAPLDNNWASYKITYSPGFGVMEIFRNNKSLLRWTDSTPIKSGNAISFRTNQTIVEFDDLKVYKFRVDNSVIITTGSASNDDLRRRDGKIKSMVRDAAGNWSAPGNLDITYTGASSRVTAQVEETLKVYPNPIIGEANLSIAQETAGNLQIIVYDMQGRELKILPQQYLTKGYHRIDLTRALEGLDPGVYFLRILTKSSLKVLRFVKQ
ncbi:hypothetical protein BKI52_34520 [marine bacterium AO1-C]|nr:hypothetical protein BKI52_34520 [marine bacterium AO1-C]